MTTTGAKREVMILSPHRVLIYLYIEYYDYNDVKSNIDKNLELVYKKKQKKYKLYLSTIEYKNILHSKLGLHRLAKTNIHDFVTFITLTFKNNITDISFANKKFKTWVTRIREIKKDFKYIYVSEFQKRGAVHYHLITNLSIKEDTNIILLQDGKGKM